MRLYKNVPVLSFISLLLLVLSILLIFDESSDSNNAITGYDVVDTKVEILPVLPKNCSVNLSVGWNMVSFYCLGMYNDRSLVLASIDGEYGSIFRYQPNDLSDPWKSYNPNLPNWTTQQLTYMDRTSGYWIYIPDLSDNSSNHSSDYVPFTYTGIYSNSLVTLYKGWNLMGYPKNSSANITTILNGTDFTVLKYYNTTADTWLVYVDGNSDNTLETFDTYKGYWIYVNSNQQVNITKY